MIKPAKSSFNYPSLGQDMETGKVRAFDNLKRPAIEGFHNVNEFSRIPAIRPDYLQFSEIVAHFFKHQFSPVSILNACGMNNNGKDKSKRINKNMTFSSLYLLASVIATRPPFFAVFTD